VLLGDSEHGAAAMGAAAETLIKLLRFPRNRLVDFQRVVVEEFFAGLYVPDGVNEDAVVFIDRFAVGIATMVDPSRFVAADLRIDHDAVVQTEKEGVRIIVVVGRIFLGNPLAGVFDDAGAFGDEVGGENAALVHTGRSDFEARSRHG
jgi:hypothetical protein